VSPLITPLIHPASILRGRHHLEPAQIAYLKRLAKDPHAEPLDPASPPPRANTTPTLEELRLFTQLARGFYQLVAFDVENAGPVLVCCGMVGIYQDTLAPGEGVCFRFRRQGGSLWWEEPSDHQEATRLLGSILRDPRVTKVGHFIIQHDVPLLEANGFQVGGRLIDTSVLLHATHSELPKGLQFCATLFCGAARWKDIPDEKEAEETSRDEGLHINV
jgi:hypothetical protein